MTYVDGDHGLLVGDQSGSTHVLDAETLSQAKQFKVPSDCCATPITAAGETVLLYDDSEDGATERWRLVDVSTGRVLRRGDLGFRVYSSAASPDGTTVAATGQGGEVVAIDLATGRQRKGSTGLGADVRWLRYSADGTRLVTGAADGTVSLWNAETLQLLGTVAPPGDSQDVPSAADFVGRSNDVTIATYSGQMYRWDTDPERSVDFACAMAGLNLTPAEWAEYLPEQPYQRVCPARAVSKWTTAASSHARCCSCRPASCRTTTCWSALGAEIDENGWVRTDATGGATSVPGLWVGRQPGQPPSPGHHRSRRRVRGRHRHERRTGRRRRPQRRPSTSTAAHPSEPAPATSKLTTDRS